MKKILLLFVSLVISFYSNAQYGINVSVPEFFDSHTHEKAFIKQYAGENWFYYFSPTDTVRIKTDLSKSYFGFMHNDSIVIAYFVHCGTECYYNFLYVKPTHKHYYLEDVLAIDWKNHILAFIPTMCNTIYFFDYLNNDTVKAYTIKNKKYNFFPRYIDTAFFWNNAFYVRWDEFVTLPNVGLPQFKPGQYSRDIRESLKKEYSYKKI